MECIKQSHKIWGRCPSNVQESLKWIERAGGVCYNSEHKITENSALPFVQNLIKRGHLNVLEHSEIALSLPSNSRYIFEWVNTDAIMQLHSIGNLRAFIELYGYDNTESIFFNKLMKGDFNEFFVMDAPEGKKRYTVEFITNRSMSHELVKHRIASFSQQSQRYVRWGIGNPMQFIEPMDFEDWPKTSRERFKESCILAESQYSKLLEEGLKPQQARDILPNACSTKIVVTADREEWSLIFALRCGNGAAPQMIDLMTPVRDGLNKLWLKEQTIP